MAARSKPPKFNALHFKVLFVFLAIGTQFAIMSAIVPIVPEMLDVAVHGMYLKSQNTTSIFSTETTVDIVGLFATPYVISISLSPIFAYITDAFGTERPLFFGMMSLLIQTLIFAFSRNIYWYILGDIFLGMSLCCLTISGISSILAPFSDSGVRLPIIAVLQVLYSVKFFGPSYAGLLYEELGQTWAFLPISLMVLINIALYCIYLYKKDHHNSNNTIEPGYQSIDEQENESSEEHKENKHVITSFATILKDVSMSSALVMYTCSSLTRSALMPIIALWLNDQFHSKFISLVYVPSYILQTIGILIAYNVSKNQFVWISIWFVIIGMSTILLPFSETLVMVTILYAVSQLLVSMVRYWMFVILSEKGRKNYRHMFGHVQALISLSDDISILATFIVSPILCEMFGFQNVCLFFGLCSFAFVSISILNHYIQSSNDDNFDV
ncbi:probable vesicular acetylcholine transporter-A [Anneissia japonica]|uniref:probable vesicular acetylcholine transporter-A n=1 Tax=Anneissia japonica TaxID=1529436 RepID=UPI0014256A13|nr:probable vesicular acetylcholine transporter-A [Anneissia japonica]